jgi:hypothetical protein
MTETIYIHAVTERRTRAGTKYDIAAKARPGERWAPIYETFDAFAASLAQRSAEQHVPVAVTWHQSAYGRELTAIAPAQTQAVAS